MQECMFFDAEQLMQQTDCGVLAPLGMRNREDVFAFYNATLSFPGYFGWNWDAFHDCIHDLSWLAGTTIHIVHLDVPLANEQDECAKLLSDLYEAKFYSRMNGKLAAHFRATDKRFVQEMVLKYYKDRGYCDADCFLNFFKKTESNLGKALDMVDKGLTDLFSRTGILKE